MKKTTLLSIVLGIAFIWQLGENNSLREDVKVEKTNVSALMGKCEEYAVNDSLNAASVTDLSLSLAEYKRYRAEDAATISKMRAELKRLKSAASVETQAVYTNTAVLSDERPPDSIVVGVQERTAEYGDAWHDITIVVRADSVDYKLRTRESLLITNYVVPKKFLFIKWGCKEVRTDVLSKNPYNEKISVESVTIRK